MRRPDNYVQMFIDTRKANDTWWRDPETGERLNRNIGEMLMLVISELSEAMEGARKDLPDTHLPQHKMYAVELADTCIRVFDLLGEMVLENYGEKDNFEEGFRHIADGFERASERNTNIGESLLVVCTRVMHAYDCFVVNDVPGFITNLYTTIILVEHLAEMGYEKEGDIELYNIVKEKMEYNAQRLDHKPEHRVQKGGKKW